MWALITLLLLGAAAPLPARSTKQLAPPPSGVTLPVLVDRTLKFDNVHPNQPITTRLIQSVPIAENVSLPSGAELNGHVVSVSRSSISILFNQLSWKGQTVPVHVRLLAAAAPENVYQTRLPLSATDRSTSNPNDWTTRQIGGDEVYLSGGSGKVYNQYSDPVGYANPSGVYANPAAPGALPRALGPFSTNATGLHGFPKLSIVSPGGVSQPIRLASNKPKWSIGNGSALLLEVVK